MPRTSPYSVHLLRHLRLTIGQNIHTARQRQKITLHTLSRKTSIPVTLLDHYELGKSDIDLNELFKIACVLGIGLGEMVG